MGSLISLLVAALAHTRDVVVLFTTFTFHNCCATRLCARLGEKKAARATLQ